MNDRIAATEAAIKVQADGVQFVRDLLALLADPKAAVKRLADIEAAATKLARAQAKLEADQAAHDTKVAAERAELEDLRRDALRQRAKLADELDEIQRFKQDVSWKVSGRTWPGCAPRAPTWAAR